jgi:hypothetical protein
LIGSPQPLQSPFAVVGRRRGLFSDALPRRSALRDGEGERRPPWIAGSMGDSGESHAGLTDGGSPRAYCFCRGGDALTSLGFSCAIEDCKSAINTSTFEVSEGWRRECLGPVDWGGLEVELALLALLEPDAFEDCDSDGVWYGLPIPNSAARLMFVGTGGASPSLPSTLDPLRLGARGGGGLEVSGPDIDCFRPLDLEGDLLVDCSSILSLSLSFDGVRVRATGPGSDGLLVKGCWSLLSGKVWDRLSADRGSGSLVPGGPNPP